MFGIEKWLFQAFPKMPKPVRVITYLVVLALFVYLVLLPRFIDGQLVVREATTGGHLPYRGGDLQIQIEGRPYKFRSNEDGFFSIPVVSRLPEGMEIQIFHADKGVWFPVLLSPGDVWTRGGLRIEVSSDRPFVKVGAAETAAAPWTQLVNWIVRPARAGISAPAARAPLSDAEKEAIAAQAVKAYAKVARVGVEEVQRSAPLTGEDRGLTYTQRIQLIVSLERVFGITIPDEHWQQMATLGELIHYVEKRKQIELALRAQGKSSARNWVDIQQSFPVDARPVYKK